MSADAAAAPAKLSASTVMTVSSVAPSLIIALISGDNACSPFMLPPYALASASETSESDLFEPIATSCAIVKALVASSMSRVPSNNDANAGRSSLSAVPVARLNAPIMSSVALTCASVAATVLVIAVANKTCCCSSSAAALAANPSAPVTAVSAAAAGSAAFCRAKCARSPLVSKFLNCVIARSIAFPSNSAMIGIDSI